MYRPLTVLLGLSLALPPFAAAQERSLRVLQAGPDGELATLAEAGEVRVVFSEPMVALGRIPQPVTAPFFRIQPEVRGTFRWSGTDTLIFTPAEPAKLPFATRFEVTIDAGAMSVAGRRLAQTHTFAFTTPTVKLLRTEWYRKGGRYDQPIVVLLRFNQPVSHDATSPHLSFAHEAHPWEAPTLETAARERMRAVDPQSADDFQ